MRKGMGQTVVSAIKVSDPLDLATWSQREILRAYFHHVFVMSVGKIKLTQKIFTGQILYLFCLAHMLQ